MNNNKTERNSVRRYGSRVLAKDVMVSNDTRMTGLNNNDLIIGSSGCGKTGGYVIPNIQSIAGSLIVSDTKGQLEKRFKEDLIHKGYHVYTLDFVNPMHSCGYNPLDGIRRHEDGSIREQDILSLANLLCPPRDSHDPFWDLSAASYVAFLIGYCLENFPRSQQNMITVCRLHKEFSMQDDDSDLPFACWAASHSDTFAAKKFYDLMAVRAADKTWASIEGFVNVNLEPYLFKEAEHIFARSSRDSFDIRTLGRRKTVLFLNTSDTDRTFDSSVNIFYTQALQMLCDEADHNANGMLKVPVRIIMDDFASSARIPHFDKIISVSRSRDICCSLIIQSLSQLNSMYGEMAAKTILNNCDHLIFLGSQDLQTATYIGERANRTPDAVLSMPRNKLYLFESGEKSRLVDKIKPYSTVVQDQEQNPEQEPNPQKQNPEQEEQELKQEQP